VGAAARWDGNRPPMTEDPGNGPPQQTAPCQHWRRAERSRQALADLFGAELKVIRGPGLAACAFCSVTSAFMPTILACISPP
jgi:hypothetical protein